MGYEETLALPVDTFWMLIKSIDRIEAQDTIRRVHAAQIAASNQKDEIQNATNELLARIGNPVIKEEVKATGASGMARLRELAG